MNQESSHRKELEQAILGAIITESSAYFKVCELLSDKNFSTDIHKKIYKAIESLFPDDKIDLIKINIRTGSKYAYYLSCLSSKVCSAANIRTHAAELLEINFREVAIKSLSEYINGQSFITTTTRAAVQEVIDEFLDYGSDVFELAKDAPEFLASVGADSAAHKIKELNDNIGYRIKQIKKQVKAENLLANLRLLGASPDDPVTRLATTKLCETLINLLASNQIDKTLADKIFNL